MYLTIGEDIPTQATELSDYQRRRDVGERLIFGLVWAAEHNWVGRTGRWCQEVLGLSDDDMRIAACRAMDNPRLDYSALGFEAVKGAFPSTREEALAIDLVTYVQNDLAQLRATSRHMAYGVAFPERM